MNANRQPNPAPAATGRRLVALLALGFLWAGLAEPVPAQSIWSGLGRMIAPASPGGDAAADDRTEAEVEKADRDKRELARAMAIEALPHHMLIKVGQMESFGEELDVDLEWVKTLARVREFDRIEGQLARMRQDETTDVVANKDLESVDQEEVRKYDGKLDLGLEIGDLVDGISDLQYVDQAHLREIIGENPRFVYEVDGQADPMLVPWMIRKAIYVELEDLGNHYANLANNDATKFKEIEEICDELLKMKDPRFEATLKATREAASKQYLLNRKQIAAVQVQTRIDEEKTRKKQEVRLPEWVRSNTSGVIIDPGNEICLVGDYLLSRGDTLPNYPNVTVESIEPSQVTYRVKEKTFPVSLPER